MTVVTNPTVVAAPAIMTMGYGGLSLADVAIDSANGNSILGVDANSLIVFRTTAAAPITVTVYADINGVETVIDTIVVPSNATFGGVRFYRLPRGVIFGDHNVSCAAATTPADKRAGSLVFKASGAALNVVAYNQIPS